MPTTTLNQRIQHFYDRSTPLWLDVWGEHMHHGYYGADGKERKDHRQAQIDLVEELLHWGDVHSAERILDVGCGVGGSARLLSSLFGASVLGLTLSPVQAKQAEEYTQQCKLQDKVQFRVQDIMTLTKADGHFDLIWSMESAEHIRDKKNLLELFYELLEPGGKFLMVTWCHRDTPPNLMIKEQKLLESIYNLYHLPPMVSVSDYQQLAQEVGFTNVKTDDWSQAVRPFWGAVIKSAFSVQGITGLLRSGWPTIKGAYAMRFMQKGFRNGVLKYGVIQGQKPETGF